MEVGTSDTELRIVAIRRLLESVGHTVRFVNLFDRCHAVRGDSQCTNARRDFWGGHSEEKTKERFHAQNTYWKWKSEINVFIGAGAYEDMAHPDLPPRRYGEWGEIGAGTLVLPHLCNFGGKGDSWLVYWDEWWKFLLVTCKTSTHEDWTAFVDKFNQTTKTKKNQIQARTTTTSKTKAIVVAAMTRRMYRSVHVQDIAKWRQAAGSYQSHT